ncbi:hypothetical protein [Microbacterium phyllosphaerae]|uniref:hypothetical protein n=1 Tax=Microbacterium phyllosphaerae TaxID=124798 RepID=UPI003D64BD9F
MTDVPALIVNFGILVVNGVAAVAAIVAVIHSRRAKKSERGAVQAQGKAEAALDRANLIAQEALDAQRLALPAPWGTPEHRPNSHMWTVKNSSGRPIMVTDMNLGQGGNTYIFNHPPTPIRVEYGDVVSYTAMAGGGGEPLQNELILEWHFHDTPNDPRSSRRRF